MVLGPVLAPNFKNYTSLVTVAVLGSNHTMFIVFHVYSTAIRPNNICIGYILSIIMKSECNQGNWSALSSLPQGGFKPQK